MPDIGSRHHDWFWGMNHQSALGIDLFRYAVDLATTWQFSPHRAPYRG
jgi:hypothetical protein